MQSETTVTFPWDGKTALKGLNFLSFDRTVMSILLENGMDTEVNMLLALSGIKDDATSTIICVPPSTN